MLCCACYDRIKSIFVQFFERPTKKKLDWIGVIDDSIQFSSFEALQIKMSHSYWSLGSMKDAMLRLLVSFSQHNTAQHNRHGLP